MIITNSSLDDLPEIFRLYSLATEYQQKIFPENQWPEFDRELITSEIEENRQFKILIDNEIACIWAITFNDPEIWEERDNDASIYLHRIATNPNFRGRHFVQHILVWARGYAGSLQKRFIRMDTCGRNERLIEHYEKSGFSFLGMKSLKNSSGLPSHYHGAQVCYFEAELGNV